MAFYRKAEPQTWTGRVDGTEPDVLRWHQVISVSEPKDFPKLKNGQQGVAFLGFACDEGVKRNLGRPGAAGAPALIRAACCNFPMVADHIVMVDAGDVVCDDTNLEEAQELLGNYIEEINKKNYLPMVIGGGHETALGGFLSLSSLNKKDSIAVINFDAHFDLREPQAEIGATSGTWAWQMANKSRKAGNEFSYLALGIQPYSNTSRLFELAEEYSFPYFLAEHFTNDQLDRILHTVNAILARADKILLSIDMDVFSSANAPGVSASSFNGLAPNAMFKRILRHIILSEKVHSVDISEVNPTYDLDNRTARLAAALLFDMVQAADINAEYPG